MKPDVQNGMKPIKVNVDYNYGHNIMKTFYFYQVFLSPQMKQSLIISKYTGIYELPEELPKEVRLRIVGN